MKSEKETRIEQLEALAQDTQHIRRNALRLAGLYLQGVKDEMMEDEVGKLDEEEVEDTEVYAAHEALLERIIDEVVKIGEELSQQAKQLRRRSELTPDAE